MNALIPIREHEDGQAVSGRDLHEFLEVGAEYRHWFPRMVEYGFIENEDYAVISDRVAREGRGYVERTDHVLTLDMAKELAMLQRTPRGKQARQYFIEVEKRARRTAALPQTYAEALRELAATVERSAALEAANEALTPRAEAWDELASADGDYSVADAAKILARAGVQTGPQRLFEQLAGIGWTHRARDSKWRAYASAVDAGYLAEKPQSHYHPRTSELVLDAPQVRVTVRGLERLRVRLGSIETEAAA